MSCAFLRFKLFEKWIKQYELCRIGDALKKAYFGTSAIKGGGVLAKSEIFIHNKYGTLLDRRGFKGLCPKICSDFLVLLHLWFLATKTFIFTVFTDRTKYYRDWSYKRHDKKRSILWHLCITLILKMSKLAESSKETLKNIPNTVRREGVPNQVIVSQFW